MNTDLITRVNMLKAAMGLNVEQLASELGISRATLNNATKASNPRRLSAEAAKRLEELEASHGLDKTDKILQAKEAPTPIQAGCVSCRDKDAEISYLREQLKKADANLAKAQDNLTAVIELIKVKNDVADHAATVSCGSVGTRHKKGA